MLKLWSTKRRGGKNDHTCGHVPDTLLREGIWYAPHFMVNGACSVLGSGHRAVPYRGLYVTLKKVSKKVLTERKRCIYNTTNDAAVENRESHNSHKVEIGCSTHPAATKFRP